MKDKLDKKGENHWSTDINIFKTKYMVFCNRPPIVESGILI